MTSRFYSVAKVKGVQRPTRVTVGESASGQAIELRLHEDVSRAEVRQVLAVLAAYFEQPETAVAP